MATSTLEANKDLVREYVKLVNDRQFDQLPDFYADGFTFEEMQLEDGGSEEGDVDDLLEGQKEFFEAFPDATTEVKEVAAEGDWVLYRLEAEGTHEGEWRGIEPTGEEVSWQFHGSHRIQDGKIVETHGTLSTGWLLAQLGFDLPFETED